MQKFNDFIIKDREQSPAAEAFRALRTTIQNAQNNQGIKTLLFASASRGNSNAYIAVNTAASLVYAGKRVILVEGDLRAPCLQDIFKLETVGLTNMIENFWPVERVLQPSGIANLRVLTSGPIPANPTGILSHGALREIILQLKDVADYVLFTSAPLIMVSNMIVSDACLLASRMDGVVLVVDTRTVRIPTAAKVMALLKGANANIIGGILNDVLDDRDSIF